MGWYADDFVVDQEFETHARTITEADIVNFAGVTGDLNPVHMDETFAAKTPFGTRIAHGPMLLGMAFGLLSKFDLFDGTVLALRRIAWEFEGPVKIGDTIHMIARVTEVQFHPTKSDQGRVSMAVTVINQNDEKVQSGRFTVVLKRR